MQIKCPKCSTSLKLASAPASGKVKCPKCSTVLKIGGVAKPKAPEAAPSQPTVPSEPTGQPAASVQPELDISGLADVAEPVAMGDFDFGNLPDPGPVAAFPQAAALPAYTPPPAKKPAAAPQDADGGERKTKSSKGSANSGKMIALAVGGVLGLVVLAGLGFLAMKVINGGGETADAEPPRTAPEGYTVYKAQGASIFLPDGEKIKSIRGDLEYKAISTVLGTVFMLGSAEVGDTPLQGDALGKKLERLTDGKARVIESVDRNGYKGTKVVLTNATRFAAEENQRAPMMNLEVFQDDGRLILIGVMQGQSRSENVVIGESLEPELEEIFYDSFKIGAKPAGFFN